MAICTITIHSTSTVRKTIHTFRSIISAHRFRDSSRFGAHRLHRSNRPHRCPLSDTQTCHTANKGCLLNPIQTHAYSIATLYFLCIALCTRVEVADHRSGLPTGRTACPSGVRAVGGPPDSGPSYGREGVSREDQVRRNAGGAELLGEAGGLTAPSVGEGHCINIGGRRARHLRQCDVHSAVGSRV